MTTNLYLRLNNLFPTDQLYRDVKNFKKKNTFPKDVVTESKKKAFEKKYKDFNLSKDENNLIYTPLNLQVVAKIYIGMILKKEYKNSFGAGVVAFYKTIRQKYLNIKRSDVSAFIKKQPIRQMTDVFKHRTNKPIISKFPNQLWCIDLIDVGSYESKNKNNVFIFNAIDVFSRKCFLEACKTKHAVVTRDALKAIIQRADVKPDYIICDNGKEFLGEFQAYCKENGISIRFNRAYSPQANGIVERCNQEIRKLMRNMFLQNENNNWIDHLRKLETTHNLTFTSAINSIPDKIWKKEKQVEDDDTKAHVASNTVLKNVKKQIAEYKDDELNVGDKVRIRMDALNK